MNNDPIEMISKAITNFATGNIGVVVGIINADNPYNSSTPYLLTAGSLVSSTDHNVSLDLNGATLFNIGSVTKTFTATMQASRDTSNVPSSWGTFGESFPIEGIPSAVADITLMQMGIYQSGFNTDNQTRWYKEYPLETVDDLINLLTDYGSPLPQNTPGTCYSYSNFAWGLLALCSCGITSVSQDLRTAWSIALRWVLIDRLGLDMPNTMPFTDIEVSNLPAGYDSSGKILPEGTSYNPGTAVLAGGGNITSNGYDMYQWLAFHMGYISANGMAQPILSMMQSTKYQSCKACDNSTNPFVGIGWFFPKPGDDDDAYLAKDGDVTGFTAYMAFKNWICDSSSSPSPTGVFVLTNSRANGGAAGLGRQFIQWLLGNNTLGEEHPEEHTLPSE